MTEIVLFHHLLGLTTGVTELAQRLRAAGHTVHTPDLFDGGTFATLDEGMAHAREVGFDAILERGVAEGEKLGTDLVYAGISMGVMPAQKLAQTRPGARRGVRRLLPAARRVRRALARWRAAPGARHGRGSDLRRGG